MSYSIVFDINKLRERCDEVNPIDAEPTVKALRDKLNKYDNLYALCAPQIGIKERVICIKFNNGVIQEYINPRILKYEDYHLVREKDVCFKDTEFISPRPQKILIEYQLSSAKPEQNVLKGAVAEVFDRMVQYLEGICLDTYGLEVIPEFDKAPEEEREEVVKAYLDSFKDKIEATNKLISEDLEASKTMRAIKFKEALDKEEIKLQDLHTEEEKKRLREKIIKDTEEMLEKKKEEEEKVKE